MAMACGGLLSNAASNTLLVLLVFCGIGWTEAAGRQYGVGGVDVELVPCFKERRSSSFKFAKIVVTRRVSM